MGATPEDQAGSSEVVADQLPKSKAAEPSLKYLEFVRLAVIAGATYALKLYNYGKEHSGSLKPSVDSVEGTVRTVTGPIAKKVERKLPEILLFADKKVDDVVQYLDVHVPKSIKDRSSQAFDVARDAARQAPDAARTVVGQVQEKGVYNTATNYGTHFQPVAEAYGRQAWQKLMTLPLAPQAAGTAWTGAEKFNQILNSLKGRHFPLSSYVPLLPLDYFQRTSEGQAQFQAK